MYVVCVVCMCAKMCIRVCSAVEVHEMVCIGSRVCVCVYGVCGMPGKCIWKNIQ